MSEAKRESSSLHEELAILHDQASAAAKLQLDIDEMQDHARINYETGRLELDAAGRVSSSQAEEALRKSNDPHNLADPAVLHADLQLLLDIVTLLGAAALGGMVAALTRTFPPIVGYILGGVVVGPSGFGVVETVVEVETLAQFGSVFFLFSHGLEYSLQDQKQFQTVGVGGTLLSMALISVAIQVLALYGGLVKSPLEGALLGLSCSLSSLSVVMDHLHDQKLLKATHGRVMVGMLAFQGLLMGVFFSLPSALDANAVSVGSVGYALFTSSIVFCVFALASFIASRVLLEPLLRFLEYYDSESKELFLLGIVSVAMLTAMLTESLGLSLDLGAFVAGLMIASCTKYTSQASASVKPLTFVFSALLFASIGMIINPVFFYNNVREILFIASTLFLIKLVSVTLMVRLFEFDWPTAFMSGMGLSHVGEFSLLFSSKLQVHNLLSRRAYLLCLAATVATLVVSPVLLRTFGSRYFLVKRIGIRQKDIESPKGASKSASSSSEERFSSP